MTVNGGGAIDFTKNGLAAGATTTLAFNGLTLGDSATPANLTFKVNTGNTADVADLINLGYPLVGGGTLTVNPSGAVVNVITTSLAAGNYNLINYGTLAGIGSISLNPGEVHVGLSTLLAGEHRMQLGLERVGQPHAHAGVLVRELCCASGGNANWGGFNASTVTTNWSMDSAGATDTGQIVGGVSDVVFAADFGLRARRQFHVGRRLQHQQLDRDQPRRRVDQRQPERSRSMPRPAAAGGMGYLAGNGIVMQPGAGRVDHRRKHRDCGGQPKLDQQFRQPDDASPAT